MASFDIISAWCFSPRDFSRSSRSVAAESILPWSPSISFSSGDVASLIASSVFSASDSSSFFSLSICLSLSDDSLAFWSNISLLASSISVAWAFNCPSISAIFLSCSTDSLAFCSETSFLASSTSILCLSAASFSRSCRSLSNSALRTCLAMSAYPAASISKIWSQCGQVMLFILEPP